MIAHDHLQPAMGSMMQSAIRIGVVLPEDCREIVTLALPPDAEFRIVDSTGRTTVVPATENGAEGSVQIVKRPGKNQNLAVSIEAKPPVSLAGDLISIVPVTPQELKRGHGIRLHQVNAGRSFHFNKQISLSLLGSLHFYRQGDHLLAVNELPLEWYLAGTVTSEMSGDCPLDFLKAQAVAARSWACFNLNRKHGPLYSHCNDDCCQRYQGTDALTEVGIQAITETCGEVLTDNQGRLLNAYYSKCCGGIRTLTAETRQEPGFPFSRKVNRVKMAVQKRLNPGKSFKFDRTARRSKRPAFPTSEKDIRRWITGNWPDVGDSFCSPDVSPATNLNHYLGRVDEKEPYFRWTVDIDQSEMTQALRTVGNFPDVDTVTDLQIGSREVSGRVTRIRVNYLNSAGHRQTRYIKGEYAIRKSLSRTFLYSSAFLVDKKTFQNGRPPDFKIHGAGWGHGMGMCQMGALGMALKGFSYEDLLKHYYEDMNLGVLGQDIGL